MNNKKEIYFIYNAKGGRWNAFIDTIHKYTSPTTYSCNLCKITHGITINQSWKNYLKNSSHNFYFLHLEDLSKYELEHFKNSLPICLEKIGQDFNIFIDNSTMNSFENLEDLIVHLDKKL